MKSPKILDKPVLKLGAHLTGKSEISFLVWAPFRQRVRIHLYSPVDRIIETTALPNGYHIATLGGIPAGATYKYRLDEDGEFPDPVSRWQPQGVHGPSAIVEADFPWTDQNWRGVEIARYILYELHTGTFTQEGTFEAIIPHLEYLVDLGVTAIELMPVAQFPGQRNWGYDGVYPFAVQDSYGGPYGLKKLVDAAHGRGLAVVLDVVYNHLGPEGNYLGQFGPYFTNKYQTPWGSAVNFDDEQSEAVRRYVVENALQWVDEFHIDGLRLDAVHAIYDSSATHILMELAEAVQQRGRELGRHICVIAESDLNDARMVRKRESEGYGLDAQWSDDFHHSLHCVLTGETAGYYCDFGRVEHLARTYANGFAYAGEFSDYRGRHHGTSTVGIPGPAFVVCSQNHDQVGNRMLGERLSHLVHFQDAKLAAGAILLSPFVPLIFMGQEYAESAPFQYFVSHSDPDLIEAVRNGRRREFAAFEWAGEVPDPQSEETFYRSRLNHHLRQQPKHAILLQFYKDLIQLRKGVPALADLNRENLEVYSSEAGQWLCLHRWSNSEDVAVVFHFPDKPATIRIPAPRGRWFKVFDSAEERWLGDGTSLPEAIESTGELVLAMPAKSFAVFGDSLVKTGAFGSRDARWRREVMEEL